MTQIERRRTGRKDVKDEQGRSKRRGGRAKEKSEGAFGLQISEGFVFQLDQLLRVYKTNPFYQLQKHDITDTAS